MKLFLIRHGETRGSLEKQAEGNADELFTEASLTEEAFQKAYFAGESEDLPGRDVRLFISPWQCCRETAELLFPWEEPVTMEGLQEPDVKVLREPDVKELQEVDPAAEPEGLDDSERAGADRQIAEGFLRAVAIARGEAEPESGSAEDQEEWDAEDEEAEEDDDDEEIFDGPSGRISSPDAVNVVIVAGERVILSILEQFSEPHQDCRSWQLPWLEGYTGELVRSGETLQISGIRRIRL